MNTTFMPYNRRTDGQTDRRTDGQTDRQTDVSKKVSLILNKKTEHGLDRMGTEHGTEMAWILYVRGTILTCFERYDMVPE